MLGNPRAGLRSDEMKWHEWERHAKACRSAQGLIPLLPTILNDAALHLLLAQCEEDVNHEYRAVIVSVTV